MHEHITTTPDELPITFVDAREIRGGTNNDPHLETYGDDLAFIVAVASIWPGHVWTDVDGADVSGLHYVNRLCYRIGFNPVLPEYEVTSVYRVECVADGCDDDCEVCEGTGDLYVEDPAQVDGRDPNPQRAFQLDYAIDIYDLRRLWRQLAGREPVDAKGATNA